jgi:hypothetical protein
MGRGRRGERVHHFLLKPSVFDFSYFSMKHHCPLIKQICVIGSERPHNMLFVQIKEVFFTMLFLIHFPLFRALLLCRASLLSPLHSPLSPLPSLEHFFFAITFFRHFTILITFFYRTKCLCKWSRKCGTQWTQRTQISRRTRACAATRSS